MDESTKRPGPETATSRDARPAAAGGDTPPRSLPASLEVPIAVLIERRPSSNRWRRWSWRLLAVLPGGNAPADAPSDEPPADGVLRYIATTPPMLLHRKELEAYRFNLAAKAPMLFVGLRAGGQDERMAPFLVTASPYEAQDYAESGSDLIEPVAMPPEILTLIRQFIAQHFEEEPFVKRRRTPHFDRDATPFARPPGWRETET